MIASLGPAGRFRVEEEILRSLIAHRDALEGEAAWARWNGEAREAAELEARIAATVSEIERRKRGGR